MRSTFTLKELQQSKAGQREDNAHLFVSSILRSEKKQKYNNQKVVIDGKTFDSLKESRRYVELRMLHTIGEIEKLECQVKFKLSVCTYISDFSYYRNGERIVEDVKSPATRKLPAYRLKVKMMESELNITVKEV